MTGPDMTGPDMTGPSETGERSMLNLLLGKRCNNRCLFCLDRAGEPESLDGETAVESFEEALDVMQRDRARGGDTIAYGRMEVALDRDFVRVVEAAHELGYTTQHLTSNGRVLRNAKLAERLVRAGINRVTISVHAPNAEVHDALSGRKGAFRQTIEGIETVAKLRARYPLTLAFACTVTASNVSLLAEHYGFLQRFTPALIGLNALLYSGRAMDYVERLSFPYTTLEEELLRLLDVHRGRLYTRLAVLGVPYCAVRRVPAEVVGLREAFRMPTDRDEGVDGWVETGAAGETGFGMTRVAACESCSMRRECPGVASTYIEHHGEEGIAALDRGYRERAAADKSLFPSDAYRYPVADPGRLPERFRRVAGGLTRIGGEAWRVVGVSALAHENGADYRLRVRYLRNPDDHELNVEVEPLDPGSEYLARTSGWGIALGHSSSENLEEDQAQARERLVERVRRLLARLDSLDSGSA